MKKEIQDADVESSDGENEIIREQYGQDGRNVICRSIKLDMNIVFLPSYPCLTFFQP